MPRLKSLDRHIPGDFQMLHPEAQQREPFKGSFFAVVREEMKFRRMNPFLAQKYGWKMDQASVERDVHDYNVQRCLAHGWHDFLDDGPAQEFHQPTIQKKILRGAVAAVETTKAGIGVWMDFIGEGGIPVDQKLATDRAFVCSDCPQNKQGGLRNWFIEKVVTEITQLAGIMKDLDVKTPHDAKLGVCEACLCPLALKAHVPMKHIEKHTKPETWAKLDKRCWMLSETGRQPKA
jgi:hypothetical protein